MDARGFSKLMERWADVMAEYRDRLIELDGAAGDSDLGLTMSDGFRAAADAVRDSDETDVGRLCYRAGKAMASAAPSTMGTLMASGLINAGKRLKGVEQLNAQQEAELFQAWYDGVQSRGGAKLGDKTFLDGLYPAVLSLRESAERQLDSASAAGLAAKAAESAFLATRGMLAKHGRMAIRGEQSRGLLDPGAAVAALLMKAYADYQNEQ